MEKCEEEECSEYDKTEDNHCKRYIDIKQVSKKMCLKMKTESVDEVPCSAGLEAAVVDDEMLVRALRKAIEVGLLPAYGPQDQYLKNWDRMKEVLQAAVGN